jgi:hypothetical protein
MEGELIVVTVISSIFGLCGLLLLDRNWFRRENFKIAKSNTLAMNKLQLEKMRKELGLSKQPSAITPGAAAGSGDLGGLLGIAQSLGKDKVLDLVDKFLPEDSGGSDEDEDSEIAKILKYVPAEVIQNALKGITGTKEGEDGGTIYNE